MKATIEQSSTELRILTPYSAPFVQALKVAIPYIDRQWQKPAWIVAVGHLPVVLSLCETYFGGAEVKLIDGGMKAASGANGGAAHLILVEYVGACKQRDDGKSAAYGWWNGGWNVIFPEEVLRGWFNAGGASGNGVSQADTGNRASKPESLYACLAVGAGASIEEIKSGYRRLARIWHPDINHEEDAQERFIAIKRAYDILGDEMSRRRYDAGLALEATLGTKRKPEWEPDPGFYAQFYRAPLTCGKIEVVGQTRLGRLYVESIQSWSDVVNLQGKMMVSSWDREIQAFRIEWVADFQVEV